MEEFVGDTSHAYAIVSHTWGEEEVSFHQYLTPKARSMAGYHKIEHSCALARRSQLPYLWIDTCCIDKSSSAELSEAINSMYKWYRNAAVCYVCLSDMKRCEVDHKSLENGGYLSKNIQIFQACRWFTRGWTLQELLAPRHIEFYDQDWISIGTKKTMWALLSKVTGIEPEHLWKSQKASVAQKMSWAANRQTTRTEDTAYSLLGLFNVNMPLLYGEGEKAFKRLQHEILQSTSDESIFAWTDDRVWTSGLLAESPANFAKSGDIIPIDQFYRKPYTITNQGFQIELRYPGSENEEAARFETPLRCMKKSMSGVISLDMTYYTEKSGALRAFRTGPFQVSSISKKFFHDIEKSYSFHIDDFRRPKLPPHWETRLYSRLPSVGYSFDSLNLRLRGGLRAEDICIPEKTSTGCFAIVSRNGGPFGDESTQFFPVTYVYWSHDDEPTHLTFDFGSFDPSSTQGPFSPNENPLNGFKLQYGQSFATCFSWNQILFIAVSRLQPREACIDIQLESIDSEADGLLKADPFRTRKDYPRGNFIQAFSLIRWPSEEDSDSSGQVMYGVPISGMGELTSISKGEQKAN